SPLLSQLGQMGQQRLVDFSLPPSGGIVGVSNEAQKAVLLHNEIDLGLPQVGRVILKNVKQSVVLCCGHWNFEQVADEVRHHRTTSSTLRIEMRHVRHRHIVGKVQILKPLLPAV